MMACSKPKHVTGFISLKISCVKRVKIVFLGGKCFVNAWPFLQADLSVAAPEVSSSWPSLNIVKLNSAIRLCRK